MSPIFTQSLRKGPRTVTARISLKSVDNRILVHCAAINRNPHTYTPHKGDKLATFEMAGTDADMKNVGCDDNRNSIIHGNSGERGDGSVDAKPAAKTSPEETVRDSVYNYCAVSRWAHRLSEWKKYMANTSESKKLPDPKEFLYSMNSKYTGEQNAIKQLIWGTNKDSLETMQSELAAIQNDNSLQIELSFLEHINLNEEPYTIEIPTDPKMSTSK